MVCIIVNKRVKKIKFDIDKHFNSTSVVSDKDLGKWCFPPSLS